MIHERYMPAGVVHQSKKGRLYLNQIPVGYVEVCGHDGSWTFGQFTPDDGFAEFAPLFGRWSLLMHADEATAKLSKEAAEELRQAECAIDSIRAMLLLESSEELRQLTQVNIDGTLIEWKE